MVQAKKTLTQTSAESALCFGPFRLEMSKRLWRGDRLVEVRPRPLAVLRYLAERRGRLVTAEELLRQLWPGIYVTRTVLRVCVHELRQALQDNPETPEFIETVGRQGYRFIAPISTPTNAPLVIRNQWLVVSSDKEKTQLPQLATDNSSSVTNNWQLTTHLVGRQKELARLRDAFERAQRGERQSVFLSGEAGIGKTALVDHLLTQMSASGPVWIGRGQCLEHHCLGEAYLPLLEALGQLCQDPKGEPVRAALSRYAPLWLAQMPGLLKTGELEAVQRQLQNSGHERMLREFVEAVEAMAAETMVVLVFEDLQWSDSATLDALTYLARRWSPIRLYLIGTYRPAEAVVSGHPLPQMLQELYGRRQCEELALELFTEAEVEEYLRRRLGQSFPVSTVSELVYRYTDGNALFMVNFVDYLLEQGLLVNTGSQVELRVEGAVLKELMPRTLQQLVLRQIERLNIEEQYLLGVASVGGRTFTAAEVAAVIGRRLEEVEGVYDRLAATEQLIQAEEAKEWPDGTLTTRYRFRHALYQQVLYEQLGQARRVRLHRHIGEWKERKYRDQAAEIAGELARHFTEGRDYRRAVKYHYQVGKTALRHSAYREAIDHCKEGLGLLERVPDTSKYQWQEVALRKTLNTALIATQSFGAEELVQNLFDPLHERKFSTSKVLH